MKLPVGKILIFVSGLGSGLIAGYFIGKKKVENRCDDEIASMKKYYEEKADLYKEAVDKKKDEEVKAIIFEDNLKNAEKAEEKLKSAVEKEKESYDKQVVNYSAYSAEESPKPKARVIEPEIKDTKQVISFDEFNEETDFDEVVLTYYTHDNVLADEDDEIVSIDGMVGLSNLELFDRAKYGDSMYIRNTDREEVIEVVFKDMSYSEDVLGNGPGGVK